MPYPDLTYFQSRVKTEDLIAITASQDEPLIVNEDKLQAAIDDAVSEFENAAAIAGYIIPVVAPTDYVNRLIFDLALYYLYAVKYDDEEMKDVYVRYNKAFQKLGQIQRGELALYGVSRTSPATANVFVTNKLITDRVFTDELLEIL